METRSAVWAGPPGWQPPRALFGVIGGLTAAVVAGPAVWTFWVHAAPPTRFAVAVQAAAFLVLPLLWTLAVWSGAGRSLRQWGWPALWAARRVAAGLLGVLAAAALLDWVAGIWPAGALAFALRSLAAVGTAAAWAIAWRAGLHRAYGPPTAPPPDGPPAWRRWGARILLAGGGALLWMAAATALAAIPWPGLAALAFGALVAVGVAGLAALTASGAAWHWWGRWDRAASPPPLPRRVPYGVAGAVALWTALAYLFAPNLTLAALVPRFAQAWAAARIAAAAGPAAWAAQAAATARLGDLAARFAAETAYDHHQWPAALTAAEAALVFDPHDTAAGLLGGYAALRQHRPVATWVAALRAGGHPDAAAWLATWTQAVTAHRWAPLGAVAPGLLATAPAWTPAGSPTGSAAATAVARTLRHITGTWLLRTAWPDPSTPAGPANLVASHWVAGWFTGPVAAWLPDTAVTYAGIRVLADWATQDAADLALWLPRAVARPAAWPAGLRTPLWLVTGQLATWPTPLVPAGALRWPVPPPRSFAAAWLAAYAAWRQAQWAPAARAWSALWRHAPALARGMTAAYAAQAWANANQPGRARLWIARATASGSAPARAAAAALTAILDQAAGRPDTLAAYRRALALNPGAFLLWYDAGQAALAAHHPRLALAWFSRAVALYNAARRNPLAVAAGAAWDLSGLYRPQDGGFPDAVDTAIMTAIAAWPTSSRSSP